MQSRESKLKMKKGINSTKDENQEKQNEKLKYINK